MGSSTAAGTKLAISAGLPASEDAAGYGALTFTTIGGPEKLGSFGHTNAETTFTPLDGPVETHKGAPDYGSIQPSIAHDEEDAGQTLLRTAAEPTNNALYSFKVLLSTGGIRYFQGRVFGYPESVEGANTVLMANPTIRINTKVVKIAAP